MDVATFAELEAAFTERVQRIVWCSVATVDRARRPRTRVLHPVWEGTTGWIGTNRRSLKEQHLARNPFISLCYWDPGHQVVYAECLAEWEDGPAEKARVWEYFKSLPHPYGYDPAMIWSGGPAFPEYGVLRLTPSRIELTELPGPEGPRSPRVWRNPSSQP